jgi:hypothetical protein
MNPEQSKLEQATDFPPEPVNEPSEVNDELVRKMKDQAILDKIQELTRLLQEKRKDLASVKAKCNNIEPRLQSLAKENAQLIENIQRKVKEVEIWQNEFAGIASSRYASPQQFMNHTIPPQMGFMQPGVPIQALAEDGSSWVIQSPSFSNSNVLLQDQREGDDPRAQYQANQHRGAPNIVDMVIEMPGINQPVVIEAVYERQVNIPVFYDEIIDRPIEVPHLVEQVVEVPIPRPIIVEIENPIEKEVVIERTIPVPVERQIHIEQPVYYHIEKPIEKKVYFENRIDRDIAIDKPVYNQQTLERQVTFPVFAENLIQNEVDIPVLYDAIPYPSPGLPPIIPANLMNSDRIHAQGQDVASSRARPTT